jgi:hypothetical protein
MGQMPSCIKVGRNMYTVVHDKAQWNDLVQESNVNQSNHGMSNHHRLIIAINPNDALHQKADTLLHEVLHCVWFQASLVSLNPPTEDEREELTISQLCPWLTLVLADNPQLSLFIHNPQE